MFHCEELENRLTPSGIPFVFTNETEQPVHVAMYGIDDSTGQWSYFQSSSNQGNAFSGTLAPTKQLGAGHDLPTFSFTGPTATLNLPDAPNGISSAVIVMTVGDVAPSIEVASNFTLPRPAPSNPTLVNANTNPYYDFIEFTLDSGNNLYINTTQVDQFGFPITLSASPTPAAAPVGVTPGISRDAIFEAYADFLRQESDLDAQKFLPLLQTANSGDPYRIISPGQYLAMPGKSADPLASYFDSAIRSFFTAPPSLTLVASGVRFVGTATTHNPVASGDIINGARDVNPADNRNFNVIDFVAQSGAMAGQHYYVYSPLDAPSWVHVQSAGEQVFANNGVFADNGVRSSGLNSSILGNLENQVVSALTRGVANVPKPAQYADTTAFWTDPAQAFPDGQRENLFAKFLHTGAIDGSPIFIDGRVYAFPYSDQGDQAAYFTVKNPTSVSITLGPWDSSPVAVSPTITSGAAPTQAAVGSVYSYQFAATGSPSPTLSASGLPNWLTFNAKTGLLTGTPTSAAAGSSASITLSASNGVAPAANKSFTIQVASAAVTPATNVSTLYLRSSGVLNSAPGANAGADVIASAGGTNHDGSPTNALVYEMRGLTGTYDSSKQTKFSLSVDSGTAVGNGTQARVSYDFNGDGSYERVETYRYFAEDNRVGWETYSQATGLKSSTGSFVNFQYGNVKLEVWNAIGKSTVSLRTDASASNGSQSLLQLPFLNLTQSTGAPVTVGPTITSGAAPTAATVGSVYSYQLVATGSPAPILSASGLPSWLTFNPNTGLLTGTPTAAAAGSSAAITLSASNGVAPAASMSIALQVAPIIVTPALTVSTSSLALGATTAGTAGSSQTFTVSGSNLQGSIALAAPTNVQLSADGNTWNTVLNLAPDAAGSVAARTVYARIAASANIGSVAGAITVSSSNAVARSIAVTGSIANGSTTPLADTLYLRSAGVLSAAPGANAGNEVIASSGGTNHDGSPTNALVYTMRGLTGTYDPSRQTKFSLFVDSGTAVGNGTQARVSYDFNGDGNYERVETYRYFAEDNRVGWETYSQATGLKSVTGSFANFQNGSVKLEVWNAIGKSTVSLRTDASASNGSQSVLLLPYANLTQSNGSPVAASPAITSGAAPASATVGSVYSYQFVATGNPAPTLSASGLPAWLTFNPNNGLLTGTPTSAAAGSNATITLSANNGVAPAASMSWTLNVASAVVTPALGSTVTFAVIGDYGTGSTEEGQVASLVKSWNPDFIVTAGDNLYGSASATAYDDKIGKFYHDYIGGYSGRYGAGSAENRFFPALGNHEWDSGVAAYLDYFNLPGNERYYDFTRGPVEIFVIDSDRDEPDGTSSTSPQAQWLKSELASSTASWKIVVDHHPPYSSGPHGSSSYMQWPYKEWGASAVISGHDHIYERLIENGLPYFVNGLGGAGIYTPGSPVAGSQIRFGADHGAMLVSANNTELTFQFITQAGLLVDSYTLNK